MKFQTPSTKFQISTNLKIQMTKWKSLEIWILEFWICLGFGYWDLGFKGIQTNV
jgi:hypothetical protein